ncbi:MAG TPA: L,D-transpeptidase, partial [Gammaproteobacteria bacterium]|nr:L,D-transpeptidase [Gammaproteobacteria bacterium]
MAIESIEINLQTQNCRVFKTDGFNDYPCSTAFNGPGEQEGSGCTPRGGH